MIAPQYGDVIHVLVAVNRGLQSFLLGCIAKTCEPGERERREEGRVGSLNTNLGGQGRIGSGGNAQSLPARVGEAKFVDQRGREVVVPGARRIVIVVVREHAKIVGPGRWIDRGGWLMVGLRQE